MVENTSDLVAYRARMVENTSDLVAYRARIRFLVQAAVNAPAVPRGSGELLYQIIPVIMPGQRIGAGAWTYLETTIYGEALDVASVDVRAEPGQWWSPKGAPIAFSRVAAEHRGTLIDDIDPSGGTITCGADSPYCRDIPDRGVATVFRDPAGTVIGGTFSWPDRRGCPAGHSDGRALVFEGIPAGRDDTRTEDYLYCDPIASQRDPLMTRPPFN